MMRAIVFRALRLTLLPTLIRVLFQRRKITIIFYHNPTPETLRLHLACLRHRYNLISLRQVRDAYQNRAFHTLPSKALVVTLDDGHAGNFELKPVLEELNFSITIFLCSGILASQRRFWFKHAQNDVELLKRLPDAERLEHLQSIGFDETPTGGERDALSKPELRELSDVVDFQSHTVSHPVLPYCSYAKAENELVQSKDDLEREFGAEVYALSYPNGDYSDREVALAKQAKYQCALTADAGFNSPNTDMFRLKRICIDDNDGVDELLVKTCGLWAHVKRFMRRDTSRPSPLIVG